MDKLHKNLYENLQKNLHGTLFWDTLYKQGIMKVENALEHVAVLQEYQAYLV